MHMENDRQTAMENIVKQYSVASLIQEEKNCAKFSYYLFPGIAAVGPAFNIFSYDIVWSDNRTHHLPQYRANALHVMQQLWVLAEN